ncbi:hypothetical protein BU23DRAFT_513289 [Bimuria novae-zelandiae CBS 107.79]|uniref:VIT-domain-containing protein n=1 Tax=Bimuria novae-zelandiae CBS 107.79 TaxID=1447943 RepID=A0A6A5V7G1_9PLEO|nr:hypothetical protein BU23DRAFT_513289 [Bimuria novae-zelandiae CBS 107.79]
MFGGNRNDTAVCGLYYLPHTQTQRERLFLPQVHIEAHATILQTTSRVTLTQTFINPSATKGLREVHYVFPLYEGVSVVGFTCHVADRVIVGEVKEKHEAKHDYTQAVARGETAGLFEQLDTSDTFKTTVGNVPPGARVNVKITYLGELKHDMEVDGIRFTIPSIIMPRYGRTAPGFDAALAQYAYPAHTSLGPMAITVDAEMAEGSFIQKMLSPTHPISVSMGTTSIAPNDEPKLSKASATLAIASARLDTDFILQIIAKDTGVPKAILENHPTIPNQRALMATLVPKFALPSENPEIVFICDRSGSMSGNRIALVKQALQVFLKSLPVGAMFNICSFGNWHSFLWPKSVSYSQQTLDEAVAHVSTFDANYGGTQMLAPLKATIEQRYKDIPLEVMMLTDGAIWDQDALFAYVNEQVQQTKAPIRVYSLGVGSGVSHSLIEGLARAGNGFSQSVGEGENMDSKVVRMLKGALSPHVSDYTLEVKYGGSAGDAEEDDDFEIVERVADSLKVKLDLSGEEEKPKLTKPISLFDPSANPDKTDPPAPSMVGESRYAHLPKVAFPNIIQAPQNIPPLFAFNRTSIYLLLGPDSPRQTPKSVVLRGTSSHGPLELEFPVHVLEKPLETIHQLAVKKATYELEQGRGWLLEAKDESGKPLKERYESRFGSMVECEAVRLGVKFQVSGKWCSFVAVEKGERKEDETKDIDWECLEDELIPEPPVPAHGLFGPSSMLHSQIMQSAGWPSSLGANPIVLQSGMLMTPQSLSSSVSVQTSRSSVRQRGGLFGQPQNQQQPMASGSSLFGQSQQQQQPGMPAVGVPEGNHALQDYQMQLMLLEQQNKKRKLMARQEPDDAQSSSSAPPLPMQASMGDQRDALKNFDFDSFLHEPSNDPATQTSFGFGNKAPPQGAAPTLFGQSSAFASNQAPQSTSFGASSAAGFGASSQRAAPTLFGQSSAFGSSQANEGVGIFGGGPWTSTTENVLQNLQPQALAGAASPSVSPAPKTDDAVLALLIKLQTFEGSWAVSPTLILAFGVSEAEAEDALTILNYEISIRAAAKGGEKVEYSKQQWATALAIVYFETKLEKFKGSWELVVDKARGWLEGKVGGKRAAEVLGRAGAFFKQVGKDDGSKARFGKAQADAVLNKEKELSRPVGGHGTAQEPGTFAV